VRSPTSLLSHVDHERADTHQRFVVTTLAGEAGVYLLIVGISKL
jgi:hypothetical protein